jgi:hypothetical protein
MRLIAAADSEADADPRRDTYICHVCQDSGRRIPLKKQHSKALGYDYWTAPACPNCQYGEDMKEQDHESLRRWISGEDEGTGRVKRRNELLRLEPEQDTPPF